jgi:hypothetical protein
VSSRLNQASTDKIAAAEKELAQLESKYAEIAADAGLAAASMLPPPAGTIADAVSLGKSVITGDWGGALLDVVGFVPLILIEAPSSAYRRGMLALGKQPSEEEETS